jgi:hypothetical protein
LSMGPGWNENDYFKTLGKLADGPMSFIPWYDPKKKLTKQLMGALAKAYPDINMDEKRGGILPCSFSNACSSGLAIHFGVDRYRIILLR